MPLTRIASGGAAYAALSLAPVHALLFTVLMITAAGLFLYWFTHLTQRQRDDVIRLLKARRGK